MPNPYERTFVPETPLRCSVSFFCACLLGCSAITFLVVFFTVLHSRFNPRTSGPAFPENIHREGNLVVYPATLDPKGEFSNQSYRIFLPVKNEENNDAIEVLRKLMDYYPKEEAAGYSDCWVEYPTYNKPCYFDRRWFGTSCLDDPNFGYKENNGTFNPCLILRLEQTGTWVPIPFKKQTNTRRRHADSKFLPVVCFPKAPSDAKNIKSISVNPVKGFANQYFPVKDFDSKMYIMPAVAVQIKGIPKGQNVTIDCILDGSNSLTLWNAGMVEIKFLANL